MPDALPQTSSQPAASSTLGPSVLLLDAIPDALLVVGEGTIVHANPAAAELLGAASQARLCGRRMRELAPDLSACVQGQTSRQCVRTLTEDERWLDCELRVSSVPWEDASAQLVSLRALGEASPTARALRGSDRNFQALVEAMPGVVYLCRNDERYSMLWLSPAVEELTGHAAEDFLSERVSFTELYHPEDKHEVVQLVDAALLAKQPFHLQYRLRNTDGSWRWIEEYGQGMWDASGELSHLVGVLSDVSDRMRVAEEREAYRARLQEARKLEGLGSLTGAIAHQFNNVLTSILGNTRLAQTALEPRSRARECLDEVVGSVQRATRLTNRMLACSDDDARSLEPLDLAALLHDHAELLRAALPERVTLKVEEGAQELYVDGATGQLEECLTSLVQNASEAYPDGRGDVWVSAGREHLDEVSAQRLLPHRPLLAGEYAYVEVRDRGTGMSTDVQHRMFDPFFTTKFTGRGLGLAVCMGAARRHRGGFRVASIPDAGTRVRLYVPLSTRRPRPLRELPPSDERQTGGLVLVVDDEAAVRGIASETLESAGFRPLLASDGTQALELAREHIDELALVVLDRVMPGLSGEATLHELRRMDAELPVLLISGYGGPGEIEAEDDHDVTFLQKPFGPHQLATRCAQLARQVASNGKR